MFHTPMGPLRHSGVDVALHPRQVCPLPSGLASFDYIPVTAEVLINDNCEDKEHHTPDEASLHFRHLLQAPALRSVVELEGLPSHASRRSSGSAHRTRRLAASCLYPRYYSRTVLVLYLIEWRLRSQE